MKYKYVTLVFFAGFLCAKSISQSAGDSCIDLRYPIYTLDQIDSSANLSYAGLNSVPDYYSVKDKLVGKTCNAGTGCDYSNTSLVYDIWYPSPAVFNYADSALPVIFFFHGGGFSDCSFRKEAYKYCRAFAQRGIIACNVEYRRGRVKDGNKTSPEQLLATYRGVQDANGAIRSIIKRQLDGGTVYKIDTSKLFVGGGSAGGIISLRLAFYTQAEMDDAYRGVSAVLGPIKKDDYIGPLSINFSIKAILNMWGEILESDSTDADSPSYITGTDDRVPVISFHGKLDPTVPYSTLKKYFSTGARATAAECGFVYQINPANKYAYVHGSEPIYNRVIELNIPTEFYSDSNAGHGLGGNANYGLSTNNVDSVQNYIVSRAAIFFRKVINNTADNTQQTRFDDTMNNSTGCPVTNSFHFKTNQESLKIYSRPSDKNNNSLRVSPNPTAGIITVTYNSNSRGKLDLKIYDRIGKILFSKTESAITGSNSFNLNLSNLKPGIYDLELSNASVLKSVKFVIEK